MRRFITRIISVHLRNTLFIGCGPQPLPSAQIRCIDVATKLGCDYQLGVESVDDIVGDYAAFVCVKPDFPRSELARLAARGKVIWDVIDCVPPREHISVYLVSTKIARDLFSHYGRFAVIPHHHCNFEGSPNPSGLRRLTWIGAAHWRPSLPGLEHDIYPASKMTHAEVVQAFRRTGIGLNLRSKEAFFAQLKPRLKALNRTARQRRRALNDLYDFHLAVNSGIKLINCIGFGIPSISSDEPAYHEIGEDCTIFSTPTRCSRWAKILQNDDELYHSLRKCCLRKAGKFHLDTIAIKYKKLIESL